MMNEHKNYNFSYLDFIKKIDIAKFIEKNEVFDIEKGRTRPQNIICTLCLQTCNSSKSLRLSNNNFVCDKCFEKLKLIKYPEIYQKRYENYLVEKSAKELAFKESCSLYNTAKNENINNIEKLKLSDIEPVSKSFNFLLITLFFMVFILVFFLKKINPEYRDLLILASVIDAFILFLLDKKLKAIGQKYEKEILKWESNNTKPTEPEKTILPEIKGFFDSDAQLTEFDHKIRPLHNKSDITP